MKFTTTARHTRYWQTNILQRNINAQAKSLAPAPKSSGNQWTTPKTPIAYTQHVLRQSRYAAVRTHTQWLSEGKSRRLMTEQCKQIDKQQNGKEKQKNRKTARKTTTQPTTHNRYFQVHVEGHHSLLNTKRKTVSIESNQWTGSDAVATANKFNWHAYGMRQSVETTLNPKRMQLSMFSLRLLRFHKHKHKQTCLATYAPIYYHSSGSVASCRRCYCCCCYHSVERQVRPPVGYQLRRLREWIS